MLTAHPCPRSQVRKQIERRVDWDTLEPRVTRLVARAEAGAKLLSSTGGEGDCCDAAPCWPGAAQWIHPVCRQSIRSRRAAILCIRACA